MLEMWCVYVCVEDILTDAHARACERLMSARVHKHVVRRMFQAFPNHILFPPTSLCAMEARTAKRIAQIDHIKSKAYYSDVVQEPDPLDETMSTRMWRHTVKLWIEDLKKKNKLRKNDQQRTALDVTAADSR